MARRLLFGFIAGALSVLVFHQSVVLLLHLLGQLPNFPWSTRPIAPFGVPAIVNQMFWGGLWGVGFAAAARYIPFRNDLAKGALYGLLGPWLLGNGILVPAFKGGAFLFGFNPFKAVIFGFNPMNMLRGALIGLVFGVGIALILRLLGRGASARTA